MTGSDHFQRYSNLGTGSIAPLLHGRGPVIYVLEFANDEQYVGQTLHLIQRFSTHARTWADIVALQILDVPMQELTTIELATIAERRGAGIILRNRAHNFGHEQASPLDDIVPVHDQRHWLTGDATYDVASFREAADRAPGPVPKLLTSPEGQAEHWDFPSVGDAALSDLSAVIAGGIPEAVSTEQTYWTISDYPKTARGRLLTLNVGPAEVLFVSKHATTIPLDDGTTVETQISHLNVAANSGIADSTYGILDIERSWDYYRTTLVDKLYIATGDVDLVLENDVALQALRKLILHLMRAGTATRFARHHSTELSWAAYNIALASSS